jgi:EH_Signature domain
MRAPVTHELYDLSLWARQLEKLSQGRHALRDPLDLARRVEGLRQRFGDGHQQLVSRDRIASAVTALRANGVDALRAQDRYVLAYGLTQSTSALNGHALIQNEQLFSVVLQRWEQDTQAGSLRGAMWRGLFRSYLQATAGPAAERLRQFLVASFGPAMRRVRAGTSWLQAVQRHVSLLRPSPCSEYVAEILAGHRNKLDDLIHNMAPPAPSWFWDALVVTMSQQIERLGDMELKGRMGLILDLSRLTQLASRRDEILARVLDRHAKTRDRSRDEVLLMFALEHWNSPQLKSSLKWSQVNPETRRMVCGWLAQEDLEDFYRLCQEDKQVDESRLRYWLRFKEQIGFSQIVLGPALFWSRDSDIVEFRQRKKGRLAKLTSAVGGNNAILMQIGDWLFAEFSSTGNACYPYRLAQLPFETGSNAYTVSKLKDKRSVQRSNAWTLHHRPNWEGEFDSSLRAWGIRPDGSSQAHSREAAAWMRELPHDLARELLATGAKVEDLRSRGGSLWIYPGRESRELDQRLRNAGFSLKSGRGYHRQ